MVTFNYSGKPVEGSEQEDDVLGLTPPQDHLDAAERIQGRQREAGRPVRKLTRSRSKMVVTWMRGAAGQRVR